MDDVTVVVASAGSEVDGREVDDVDGCFGVDLDVVGAEDDVGALGLAVVVVVARVVVVVVCSVVGDGRRIGVVGLGSGAGRTST